MKPVNYVFFAVNVRQSSEVPVYENCNGYVAINKGMDIVTVDNVELKPPVLPTLSGESFGVAGNLGEVYNRQSIKVVFQTTVGPNVLIVQKVYATNTFANV